MLTKVAKMGIFSCNIQYILDTVDKRKVLITGDCNVDLLRFTSDIFLNEYTPMCLYLVFQRPLG